ncbi:MAG TPA: GNAT family N-acetyltransferase [Longimicrobiaceae bacterium]|nr:GNAT family N-acetyltransferase [Longimicrobiaceae bacterium]
MSAMRALDSARLKLRPLRTPADYDAVLALQHEVWGDDFDELVPSALLRVVPYVGGIAAGAFSPDGELTGFVFGVSGVRNGKLVHWSDTLAVRPKYQNRGVGLRLKRHQRDVLLDLGIREVYWTFDPLDARNAYFNLSRLGAVVREYHRDFYGDSRSTLHTGIGTDRFIAVWDLKSDRVTERVTGNSGKSSPGDYEDAPLVNKTRTTPEGPATDEPNLDLDAERIRIAVPEDVQQLKEDSAGLARQWRRVTRAAFEKYLGAGYVAVEMTRNADCSCYVLEKSAPVD